MNSFNVLLCTMVMVKAGVSREVNDGSVENEKNNTDATPRLPVFGINSFTLPGLNLQGLSASSSLQPVNKIKVTRTEYIEVTRRQTVHPVCYTMYENKAPCLPHRSIEEEDLEMDSDTYHEVIIPDDNAKNEKDMSSYMKPVMEVLENETRDSRYLRFVPRTNATKVTSKPVHHLEGSETQSVSSATPSFLFRRPSTEYVTTTVLLTKVEKYTDHRVTATMVALNCLPVDPAMPKCRRFIVNPIVQIPIRESVNAYSSPGSIVISPVYKVKEALSSDDAEIVSAVEAVKKAVDTERLRAESPQRPKEEANAKPGKESTERSGDSN